MAGKARALVDFEAYGAEARDVAIGLLGPDIEKVERILGVTSPNAKVRFALGRLLWGYARDVARKGGSGLEQVAPLNAYIKALHKTAKPFSDALQKCPRDAAATVDTLNIMFLAYDIDARLTVALEGVLAVTPVLLEALEKIMTMKRVEAVGGKPPDVDYHRLMAGVAAIFKEKTGRAPGVTTDRINGGFSGDFFRIAEIVDIAAAAAVGRLPRTNTALGKLLERLTKWLKKQELASRG